MNFYEEAEQKLITDYLKNGYVIFPLEKPELFKLLKEKVFSLSQNFLELPSTICIDQFFNKIHEYVPVTHLNQYRMHLIGELTRDEKFKPIIYNLGKKTIHTIVGNELSMQRMANLSIQMPGDASSLLPLHTDVWAGNSPYEVVFWLPLVNCFKSKSMFILPLKQSQDVFKNFKDYSKLSVEELTNKLKKDLVYLDVPEGHGVIFSHYLLHGNDVNLEKETRFTFNIRFKSLLSPYCSKGIGETFVPITVRPSTRIGFESIIPEMNS